MPESILDAGVNFIICLQSLGEWLAPPMRFFSFLGYEPFYLLIAPALYWSVDSRAGLRIGLLLMLSASVNYFLKLALQAPRPYWYDPRIKPLVLESSFGIPSGHAQQAVVLWGSLAASYPRRWLWIVALFLIFFIGLSRVYLGVHFPSDVLGGWLAGAAIIWTAWRLEDGLKGWLNRRNPAQKAWLAFLGSFLILLSGLAAAFFFQAWTLPGTWITVGDPIEPVRLSDVVSGAGGFLGLAGGAAWLDANGGYRTHGPIWKRLVRFPIGMLVVIALWRGSGVIFPGGESTLAYLLLYLRYALVGLWISALAPLFFYRLSLAEALNDN